MTPRLTCGQTEGRKKKGVDRQATYMKETDNRFLNETFPNIPQHELNAKREQLFVSFFIEFCT